MQWRLLKYYQPLLGIGEPPLDGIGVAVGVVGVLVALVAVPHGNWVRLWGWIRRRQTEVAIGVVVFEGKVALVHRTPRKGELLRWQFPAGSVRTGEDAKVRVVDHVASETGLHVSVSHQIGQRIHPQTGKNCVYLACDREEGDLRNGDPKENKYVEWVPLAEVEAYVGKHLFFKVRDYLEDRKKV